MRRFIAVLFIGCLAFAACIASRAPEVLAAGQPVVTPGSATITDPGGSDLSGFMIVVEPSGHAWAIDGAGHASGELSPAITQSLFADLASAGPLAQLPEQPCASALVIGWNGQRSRNLLCSSDARVARLMGDIDAIQKALYVHSYRTTASLYHTAAQPKLIAQSSARFWTSGQSAATYSPTTYTATTYSPTTYTPTTYTPYSYNASSSANSPLYNGAGSPYGNTGFDSSSTSFSQDFRIDPTQSFGQNNIGGSQSFSNGSSFTTNGTSFNSSATTPSSSFGGSFSSGSTGGSFSGSSSFRSDFSGNFNSSTFGSGPYGPTTYGSGAPTSSYH